jgi:hypothetical protein
MSKPKTASELTEQRQNLAVSYYQNALEVSDPNRKILSRPRGGLPASIVAGLRAAQTEVNLGITAFRQTYPNVTPDVSQYPFSKQFDSPVVFTANGTFTVPTGAAGIEVHLWGGGGKGTYGGASSNAGSGAYVTGTINLGDGVLLNIAVNAGAGGTVGVGGPGGGYTGIYRGTNAQSNYFAIAGGGGGAANNSGGSTQIGGGATWSGTAWQGGQAGSLTRSTASNATGQAPFGGGTWYIGGGGGSQTEGGQRGGDGGAGSALQGGNGSPNPNNAQGYQLIAGGGGGGYFGGGGSGNTYGFQTGGGGGSSYTGGLINASGEDGAPASAVPGGVSTKYYVAGFGGAGQNGRAVIVPFRFVQNI